MTTNIPAGWALVPLELPEQMLCQMDQNANDIITDPRAFLAELWLDLLAAAPTPPVDAVPGEPVTSNLPERDPKLTNRAQGVYRKFDVRRTDGSDQPGCKHDGCEYFVIDVTHDQHAKAALTAYANACESTHHILAADMRDRYGLATPTAPQAVGEPAKCLMCNGQGMLGSAARFEDGGVDCPDCKGTGAAPVAPRAGEEVLPDGWVPCFITYEGDEPEEVAFGPQRMMDRLKKWLTSYFEHVYAERYPATPPAPAKGEEAMGMALCEIHRVVIRPGQLYTFSRVGDCEKCAAMEGEAIEAYEPIGVTPIDRPAARHALATTAPTAPLGDHVVDVNKLVDPVDDPYFGVQDEVYLTRAAGADRNCQPGTKGLTVTEETEGCRCQNMDWHKGGKCTSCPDAPNPADPPEVESLPARITQYLVSGGLFNPEMMDHDAVRDLLIDARQVIDRLKREIERLNEGWHQANIAALKASRPDVEEVMALADEYEESGRFYITASPRNADRLKAQRDAARSALRAKLEGRT